MLEALVALITNTSIEIVDGDTVRYRGERIRLQGYDAPEIFRPKCIAEHIAGLRASARLRTLLADRSAKLTINPGQCGYGRRCGTLTVNGRDVGAIMIGEGLASPMVCAARDCPPPKNWCLGG